MQKPWVQSEFFGMQAEAASLTAEHEKAQLEAGRRNVRASEEDVMPQQDCTGAVSSSASFRGLIAPVRQSVSP